ncbi:MAG: hypothetical protein ACFFCZ_17640 [Promethearchaeota archaeon]
MKSEKILSYVRTELRKGRKLEEIAKILNVNPYMLKLLLKEC